jgi:hypothetical protein
MSSDKVNVCVYLHCVSQNGGGEEKNERWNKWMRGRA